MTEEQPKSLTLSPKSQRRWALAGCGGCLGFACLGVVLAFLGAKQAVDSDNVWGQLSAYMEFETPPEGFKARFVVPFFDQRQIIFYRESDKTQVTLQEFSGRVREDFEDAFDVALIEESGAIDVVAGELELQGHKLEFVRFVGGVAAAQQINEPSDLRDGVLGFLDMRPEDLPDFPTMTPLLRLRFSGSADSGGTVLTVQAPTAAVMTLAELEELFRPFDLWSQVGSAPKAPELIED